MSKYSTLAGNCPEEILAFIENSGAGGLDKSQQHKTYILVYYICIATVVHLLVCTYRTVLFANLNKMSANIIPTLARTHSTIQTILIDFS